jgi:hypothetical protein
MKHLKSFKFPLMGNLYPSGRPEFERVTWFKDLSSNTRFASLSDDAEFAIGEYSVLSYGDRVRPQNGRGVFEISSSYLTSLLHLHIFSTTNRKIAASTVAVYNKNHISEFENMIAAYESLLSFLPDFSPFRGE